MTDAWGPEPCQLREGAHSDVSHSARNIALLRAGVREGALSREAAAESIARIHRRARRLKDSPDECDAE